MKKVYLLMLLLVAVCYLLSGCGNADAAEAPVEVPVEVAETNFDVDLTGLSSTMTYAEVYNITNNPAAYLGKSMKLSGMYYYSHDEASDEYSHFVLISDVSACCEQGVEFVIADMKPDDYPSYGDQIEIAGVFSDYVDGGVNYCRVEASAMKLLSSAS